MNSAQKEKFNKFVDKMNSSELRQDYSAGLNVTNNQYTSPSVTSVIKIKPGSKRNNLPMLAPLSNMALKKITMEECFFSGMKKHI